MDLPIHFVAEEFVEAAVQGEATQEACDRRVANHRPCFWLDESALLNAHPRLLRRSGRTLFVRLTNGEEKAFLDTDDELNPGGNVLYLAEQVFANPGFVTLLLRYYEGLGYLLVDTETCSTKPLTGKALFSADGKRLAVRNESGYEDEVKTGLFIYRIEQRKPTLEFSTHPEYWRVEDFRWRDRLTMEFLQEYDSRHIPDGEQEKQWRTLTCKAFREEICFEWRLLPLDNTAPAR